MAGSAEIRQLRRRIKTVKNTQKITRAFEMIAASRILKAQRRVNEARPYAEQITAIIRGLAASNEAHSHPLLTEWPDATRTGLVVLTSDRGLAGAYNANVLKRADAIIEHVEAQGNEVDLFVVGNKAQQHYKFRGRETTGAWSGVSDSPNYPDAAAVAADVMDNFTDGRYQDVQLVYTDFQSALNQVPTTMQLLPVDPSEFAGGEELSPEFIFEPDPQEILDLLIPKYVEAKIFAGMLESAASEHASRQRAMKSATDNAEDVVNTLTTVMNQARQDQVTTELTEIVGGAAALSDA
ncbi:F0F1 ATP synthase subunit gamma [Salsipaludibacter albus]|uniref:F0F1 ATP synthase subunit gamma n=1 Tax=Salsipaludibacter albus TaxID=2849650 RepID=UPI001EE3A495|nr:F0F1 ATP synthase subunit gamma [Salsipaludibacter albus]